MQNIFFLLFLFGAKGLLAQGFPSDYVSLSEELQRIGHEQEEKKELAGSPFWEEEYIPGEIKRNGKKEIEAYFRYDVLNDQVRIKVNPSEDQFYLLPRWGDLEYETGDYSYFLSHKITEDEKSLYGYFIKYFASEDVKFFGKPLAEVLPAQRAETSYDKGRPATIKVKSNYYIQFGDEPLIEVKIKERDFRKLFNESKRMKSYFKEQKVKDIDDVVRMLHFFEEEV